MKMKAADMAQSTVIEMAMLTGRLIIKTVFYT